MRTRTDRVCLSVAAAICAISTAVFVRDMTTTPMKASADTETMLFCMSNLACYFTWNGYSMGCCYEGAIETCCDQECYYPLDDCYSACDYDYGVCCLTESAEYCGSLRDSCQLSCWDEFNTCMGGCFGLLTNYCVALNPGYVLCEDISWSPYNISNSCW